MQWRGVGKAFQGKEMLGAGASGRDSRARARTGMLQPSSGRRQAGSWDLPEVPLSMQAMGLSSWGVIIFLQQCSGEAHGH